MTLIVDLAYNNMTTKNVNGKDVDIPIDWSTISPLPDGVVTKVSELNFLDPSFVANWHGVGGLNLRRAGYHFYRNGQLFYNSARQAKTFSDALIAQGIKDNDYFVLDNEEKDAKGNSLVSLSESLDWSYNVKVNLQLPDYDRFWLYSTADILNHLNVSKLNNAQLAILKQIKIWVAGYPKPTPELDGILTALPSRYAVDQTIYGPVIGWQFAAEVPNISNIPGGVDLNQITADFLAKWKGGQEPTPVPTPTPNPSQTTIDLHKDVHVTVLTGDPNTQVKVEMQ